GKCSTGAPGFIASSRSKTAGSSRYSASISSKDSSAISRLSAATSATTSPTWRLATRSHDRLVIDHRPEIRTQAGQIVARDHGDDARQFLCLAGIDSEEIGGSIWHGTRF